MPEKMRTADWFTADYALMIEVGSVRTDDYWIIERNSSGVSVNSSSIPVFTYYLCGCDGSVRLIYQGGSKYPEDVWNSISKWF